ncbi:MAG: YcjF family protein [Opitutaceae bacterium]|nr:YcjF family protein [Opitutaceae bacterium]
MSTETIAIEEAIPEIETTETRALKLTRRYALWSMGGGLIPVVGLDIAAIITAQIKMLHDMSKIYGVEFKENRAKSIVTSLIGSLGIVPIGTGILFSVIKLLPLVGPLAATVALPVSAGAITYATGKVFITHFESGGTFLDLNPAKMKAAYRKMFEEGKAVMTKKSKEAAK